MNQLTKIAALPGSGAGSTSALRAETVRGEKKGRIDLGTVHGRPLPQWAVDAGITGFIIDEVIQKAIAATIAKVLTGANREGRL